MVSDVPLTVGQARAEIVQRVSNQALSSREVLACVSHPGEDAGIEQVAPQDALPEVAAEAVTMSATSAQETSADPVDNYRAVTGTARCDQHKRLPVDNCGVKVLTCTNVMFPQVVPCRGLPWHGQPRHI